MVDIFNKIFEDLEFEDVKDQAAAMTVITAKLVYEDSGQEIKKSFEFRLINLDSDLEVQVRDILIANGSS
jgi:hypothetical protein